MVRRGLLLCVSAVAMRAGIGVNAGFRQPKTANRTAVNQMLLDDLIDVAGADVAVPDRLGIDDNNGSVLALIEAAGLVGADFVLQAGILDGVFEGGLEVFGAVGKAAGPGGRFIPFVVADEEVVFKERHLIWILAAPSGCVPYRNCEMQQMVDF
jgi:hypothetical protein